MGPFERSSCPSTPALSIAQGLLQSMVYFRIKWPRHLKRSCEVDGRGLAKCGFASVGFVAKCAGLTTVPPFIPILISLFATGSSTVAHGLGPTALFTEYVLGLPMCACSGAWVLGCLPRGCWFCASWVAKVVFGVLDQQSSEYLHDCLSQVLV